MDTAVYWVEYVVRNGPDILRTPALKLTWWQLALLDVYGVIILVFILTNVTLFYAVKYTLPWLITILLPGNARNDKKTK